MNRQRRRFALRAASGAAAVCAPALLLGQTAAYPSHAVRVVVPFPPGGGTDILARLLAQQLGDLLGQQFLIENVGGAGGNIGTAQAARAAPDGYTVLFAYGSFVVNPSLFAKVPYDVKDFDPVTLAASTTGVLVVNPSVPAKTVKQLGEHVRAHAGNYSYASGGFGTQAHLTGEQLRLALNVDLVHVPFPGAGPSMASVMAGHTPIGIASLAACLPQVRDNRLRALAVTGRTRSEALPDVPTMAEAGFPDILGDSWVGVLVPAGAPAPVVATLNREIVRVIERSDIKAKLATLGYDPVAGSPQQFAEQIRTETQTWAQVIRSANIQPI